MSITEKSDVPNGEKSKLTIYLLFVRKNPFRRQTQRYKKYITVIVLSTQ